MTATAQRVKGKWTHWTDDEWKIVHESLDQGTSARSLLPKLPGRHMVDIFNARSIAKRRRLQLCLGGCGKPKPPDAHRCPDCLRRQRDRRADSLKNGCCAACNQPIDNDPNASGTVCGDCREYRHKYQGHRPPVGAGRPATRDRIVPWAHAGSLHWMTEHLARHATNTTHPRIVDLFGGTGHACIEMILRHRVRPGSVLWNDIHPGLHALLTAVCQGDALPVWNTHEALVRDLARDEQDHAYLCLLDPRRDPHLAADWDTVTRAAITLLRHPPKDRPTFLTAARRLRQSLTGTALSNDDFEPVLRHVLDDPTPALVFVDPPWPGKTDLYEFGHTMTTPRFETLVTLLDTAPHRHAWVMSFGAERLALQILAQTLPQPWSTADGRCRVFWRTTVAFRREIVVVSPQLAIEPGQGVLRIDPHALGLLKDTTP